MEAGAHVVAGSRSRGAGLEALEEAGAVTFVAADLSQPGGADDLVAAAADRGGIDVHQSRCHQLRQGFVKGIGAEEHSRQLH
ncbi:hypothetical protein [Nocardia sp. NPDC050793]|uniref:hypothetical protein n=1 Tax=Nocardia sp. NPDC050793 TaxID=3155159 RepID=UPI00340CDF47